MARRSSGGTSTPPRGVKSLTGNEPGTPYGFYSAKHNGLFMNIATGGGTLVHEIVHPYVEADFPNAPPWLNEGLGSLFEQSADRDGHIVGLTNWRLAGLQRAIRANRTGSSHTCGSSPAAPAWASTSSDGPLRPSTASCTAGWNPSPA